MLKKVVLLVVVTMLIAFGTSISFANQIGGMASGTGPVLGAGWQASLNPGGLGDALVYGYYNVRGNLNLINIVNTNTTHGEKVRVIFRAGATSQEVLDFSVCLSRGDVWTAYLWDDGTQGRIIPLDSDTITAPLIPAAGQPFKVPTGLTADQTKEGYIEVLGLSEIDLYDHNVASPVIANEAECAAWNGVVGFDDDVKNVLMGNNTIVDVATLETFSYNATAIADANIVDLVDPGPGSELSIPTSMSNGCAEADALWMKADVISPYDIVTSLSGETEVIITFPTRRACHNVEGDAMFEEQPPASSIVYATSVVLSAWDEKEHSLNILDFSPTIGTTLPNEVNVLKIGGSKIWNSTLAQNVSVGSFELGWITVNFTGVAAHTTTYAATVFNGLPALAYTTQSFFAAPSYMTPAAHHTNIGGVVFP